MYENGFNKPMFISSFPFMCLVHCIALNCIILCPRVNKIAITHQYSALFTL